MYADSHCHLDPEAFDDDAGVDAAVLRAREAGVGLMVAIGSGYGVDCAEAAVRVAERHPDVWFAAGVHPHDAKAWSAAVKGRLVDLARHDRCVALGEMGLDFHYDNSPRDQQRACLREQIRLALDLHLPVVIHDRASGGETFAILEDEGAFDGAGVLYHCFTGDVAAAERIVASGGFVSIPGIVTFKNGEEMRDVARAVPLEHLLVETDSPFLTPVPFRGQRNEPARVAVVSDFVAELRGMTAEAFATAMVANTRRYFGIPG